MIWLDQAMVSSLRTETDPVMSYTKLLQDGAGGLAMPFANGGGAPVGLPPMANGAVPAAAAAAASMAAALGLQQRPDGDAALGGGAGLPPGAQGGPMA